MSSKLDVVPTGSATSVLLRIEEDTPGRARAIAGVLGPIVQAQAAIDQRGRIGRRLRRLRLRAESPDASRRERTAITRRSRALRRLRRENATGLQVKAGPALDTEPTGAVNDLVERLPGDYSRGPSPLWSGLAGLALALTSWRCG